MDRVTENSFQRESIFGEGPKAIPYQGLETLVIESELSSHSALTNLLRGIHVSINSVDTSRTCAASRS
ncbi:MAG: hypothetical protein EBW21_05445 [Actinobacteria bacterium]|nr:hypothetical protein [Actinomycetota bacterium]